MQPVLSLNPHLGTFNFSPGTIIPPQILIPNSWLVRGRINRRSLRVSHRVPLSTNVRRLSLAGRSTFLIACHSAFKLLRRRSACSDEERERGGILYLAVDRPRSACGQSLHAKRQTHALATKALAPVACGRRG